MLHPAPALYPLVKDIQINVAEQLGCQIAYRYAAIRRRMEKALVIRKFLPRGKAALDPTVDHRLTIDNQTAEPDDGIPLRKIIRKRRLDYVEQTASVYVHEIAAYIEIENMAWLRIIPGTRTDVMIQAFYTI